ncbi:MAG: hypothetical protein E6Q98_01260 [Rhodospirillaceae bacterium]|nr:MAG: hypothetical protein E6Q98_01260 [Rhodospirillaceae bacterium]
MAVSIDKPKLLPFTPVRLDMFARTHINNVPYRSPRFEGKNVLMIRDDGSEWPETFDEDRLKSLFDDGKVRIEADYYNPSKTLTRLQAGNVLFKDLAPEEQAKILERKGYCDHLLNLLASGKARRSGLKLLAAIRTHFAEIYERAEMIAKQKRQSTVTLPTMPSPDQVRRWLKRYENSNFDPLSLLDRRRRASGNRKDRLLPELRAMLERHAAMYISSKRPSKAFVYREYFKPAVEEENAKRVAEGKKPFRVPDVKALERAVAKLNKFHVVAGRHTTEWARKHFTIVNDGLQVFWPLQRVEIDEWHVQLHTLLVTAGIYKTLSEEEKLEVDRARVWMTAAICCTTRCLLSFVIHTSKPSARTALECLKLIFVDKSHIGYNLGTETAWAYYGRPHSIFTDNGSALASEALKIAAMSMGCELSRTPPAEPGLRARIERVFGSIGQRLLAHFTGRTFSNVVDRGLYPAQKAATLTLDELVKAMTIYVVDVYHLTPHEGLFGETPFDAWNRQKENWQVDTLIDKDELRHVFGLRYPRTITDSGIEIAGLYYQSRDLMEERFESRLQEVEIRIDTDDISKISVETPKGYLTVECVHKETKNLGLTEWIEGARQIAQQHANQAKIHLPVLFRAARKLQKIGAEAEARAGIVDETWTPEKLEKVLHDHLRVFQLIERAPPSPHGLFGNIVDDNTPDDDTDPDLDLEPTSDQGQVADAEEGSPSPKKARKTKKSNSNKPGKVTDVPPPTETNTASGFTKWHTEDE